MLESTSRAVLSSSCGVVATSKAGEHSGISSSSHNSSASKSGQVAVPYAIIASIDSKAKSGKR
ncbi:hypothetical protein D3C76_1541580 [compost metagenome]